MANMREWDELVGRVAAIASPDDSLRKLLHEIADMLQGLDCGEANDAYGGLLDQIDDMAFALRAKTEGLTDAILRKPRPAVIALPDAGDD